MLSFDNLAAAERYNRPVSVAEEMLAGHVRGQSTRTLGARFGVSRETARKVVISEGRSLIASLERDLSAERWLRIKVPYGQAQEDWRDALLMFDWATEQLKARGWDIAISHRPSPDGSIFTITTTGGTK